MEILLDTNVLLRWLRPEDPHHGAAAQAIEALNAKHETLCITPQSLTEFWYVATRPPHRNGYGLTPALVEPQLARIEKAFPLAEDRPEIYDQWKRLVTAYGIGGPAIFDARLAAVMLVHGITRVLTFNGPDFARYIAEGIMVVDPLTTMPRSSLSQGTQGDAAS